MLHYPLVDVKLRRGTLSTTPLKAYIDSGSAYCIFGSDTADILEIEVRAGRLRQGVKGIGGGSVDLYFFNIELVLDSIKVDCYAGFMDHEFPGNGVYIGLLGDYGFFSEISVALDIKRLQIRIG